MTITGPKVNRYVSNGIHILDVLQNKIVFTEENEQTAKELAQQLNEMEYRYGKG